MMTRLRHSGGRSDLLRSLLATSPRKHRECHGCAVVIRSGGEARWAASDGGSRRRLTCPPAGQRPWSEGMSLSIFHAAVLVTNVGVWRDLAWGRDVDQFRRRGALGPLTKDARGSQGLEVAMVKGDELIRLPRCHS
jgi:hypothetical protein